MSEDLGNPEEEEDKYENNPNEASLSQNYVETL